MDGTRDRASCRGFLTAGQTRRDALRAGALSLGGLSLPGLFRAREASAAPMPETAAPRTTTGRAKACILVFAWGGPSQLDTWDPKPEAPDEIRGEFSAIETRVPGVRIGEHFPMLADRLDRLAIVRSMTHDDPAHLSSVHHLQTGHLAPRPHSDADGPSPNDWPHLGALVARVRPVGGALPPSVIMPWTVSHPAAPGGKAPGQHGGWLGKSFDPFLLPGDPNLEGFRVEGLGLPEGLADDRVRSRRALLSRFERDAVDAPAWSDYRARAFDALLSAEARGAFRVDREPPETRDRYGRHIHGQCLLMARRLVEAGVPLVTVNWHDDGINFWDTHGDNFNGLKTRLMPPTDRGLSALIDDLAARGMMDETLVVWVGEFGRAPRITRAVAGREHWPRCYSAVLAGGGIRGGAVFGSSDRWAAHPEADPVGPADLAATILHALGISPETEIVDPVGRPLPINRGVPVTALFG
ncbi:DUF1501 domain-containing protein [Tautonia plasticadhaerens]|uniref:DUF1501 domain-containing protein n=1 Tax=Tautonia plasticadhaerens TaxID=2527974 RepID=A0A518GUP4_9BACT|nr:DUF1501 domain-containing protein [Tautonia plasticadhaerens]QDV32307.1 hypothetical protein ElP_01350 [Tautonia plasticadhaerens]